MPSSAFLFGAPIAHTNGRYVFPSPLPVAVAYKFRRLAGLKVTA